MQAKREREKKEWKRYTQHGDGDAKGTRLKMEGDGGLIASMCSCDVRIFSTLTLTHTQLSFFQSFSSFFKLKPLRSEKRSFLSGPRVGGAQKIQKKEEISLLCTSCRYCCCKNLTFPPFGPPLLSLSLTSISRQMLNIIFWFLCTRGEACVWCEAKKELPHTATRRPSSHRFTQYTYTDASNIHLYEEQEINVFSVVCWTQQRLWNEIFMLSCVEKERRREERCRCLVRWNLLNLMQLDCAALGLMSRCNLLACKERGEEEEEIEIY
jgi:hypothetical protein